MKYSTGPYLEQINVPADLREKFDIDDLPHVAGDVRQYIIDVISEIGNSHFGASLGVVELTVALHYVFNTPEDQLVWDVGHQAYGHKILTGRKEAFPTNRLKGGISGFPKRSESEYDTFGVGHSSTSISGPDAQSVASKISTALKGSLLKQSNMFESLNFRYFGPIDGHDAIGMAKIMEDLKDIPGPKILHCITRKGAGYKFSEEGNPTQWHAPGVFNKETGEIVKVLPKSPQPPKYQDVFGHTIVELAEKNDKIMGVTPAMPTGSSLTYMMAAMPERSFDVGIAEQHAVTFSAGLATQGMVPFCNIYSTFMQRAYDQVLHDVALQNLNVVFCLDRAGLVGADGATHHGAYDLAYMRCIPNMVVSAPMDEPELRNLMFTAQQNNMGPFSIRYPRGKGMTTEWKTAMKKIKVGTGRKLTNGKDVAILTVGHPGNFAQEAIDELKSTGASVAHYDMRFVKPLDETILHEVFTKFDKVITVEDGCLMGGFGAAVIEFMADQKYSAEVVRLGIPDKYIQHGTQQELWDECGYDTNAIVATIKEMLHLQVGDAAKTAKA